jgi:MOSC domain-containing protein YiiM
MNVSSVSVGLPQEVESGGQRVITAIFKQPVSGRVRVFEDHLEGDRQADRDNHGGPNKAVYAYPHEHYGPWAAELGRPTLPPSQFGENLTVSGLLEEDAGIGDELSIGTARFRIAQPRKPCFKLGIRVGEPTFPKRFLASGRVGFYLTVLEPGEIEAGDPIAHHRVGPYDLRITDIWRIVFVDREDREGAERVLRIPWLAGEFRRPLERRLASASGV